MAIGKKTGGRKAGTPNVATRTVREHFAHAFELLQESPSANIMTWAESNPTEFYRLASKLIPLQVANDPDNPMPGTIIQIIPDTNSHPIV
jgi:hypothetical protein